MAEVAMTVEDACVLARDCHARGDREQAESLLATALRHLDDRIDLLYQLGNVAIDTDARLDEVFDWLRESPAARAHPSYLYSMAVLCERRNDPPQGLAYIEQALARFDDPLHLAMKSHLLWHAGDIAGGYATYEAYRKAYMDPQSTIPLPRWQGEDIGGKTILLQPEQGIGDTVQHLRFAEAVAARGARVVALVQPQLTRLAATVPGIDGVLGGTAGFAGIDIYSPVLALPHVLKLGADDLAPRIPYMTAPEVARARWRGRIAPGPLNIGVVWSGNPLFLNNHRRSLPLTALAPLAALPGARLYSLQCGDAARDIAAAPFALEDLGAEVADFADTAALMEQLDLVVTMCTSACHVAGALGCPTLLLLSNWADGRWMIDRHDTPWYPNTRLVRQGRGEDWHDTVTRAAELLEKDGRRQ
jgi:hypothetical protein